MGKVAGTGCKALISAEERVPLQEIERSIITKYRRQIWTKFVKAIKDFNLIEDGDKIAVAVSGGKDSILMAKLFQELQCHGRANFELEFIAMDPGYHEDIRQLFIPINIFESNIFEIVDNTAQDYPCYMCAKMRRGALYGKQWLSLARNIQTLLFPEKPAVAKHT